uniref:Uncharacterized protein n=1 Tax=Anguilla anguilla TaxID=7936 RepID=A0A0E9WJU5_ANGAN
MPSFCIIKGIICVPFTDFFLLSFSQFSLIHIFRMHRWNSYLPCLECG